MTQRVWCDLRKATAAPARTAFARSGLQILNSHSFGEDAQYTGLLTMIQGEVQFPFRAQVLGEETDVVDMEWPADDEFGLDLVIERGGQRHRIEARNVDLVEPFPEGHLFLAAYLDWKRRLG